MQLHNRSTRYTDQKPSRTKRIRLWKRIAAICTLIAVILLAVWGITGLRSVTTPQTATLPCRADQHVTVFGDNVLYYDDTALHCMTPSGSIRWSFTLGSGASFAVSDSSIVLWNGTQLYILDKNGHPTYNEEMSSAIQFARVCSRYCAVVTGGETEPELTIKRLNGEQVDTEVEAFSGMMLMDVGFYGAEDQYLWTLSMDVYGSALNTVLNTFQVAKMNTGIVNLGEYLAYRALYENNRLRVFTTQQMYTYDYKGVQDPNRTQLVFGWELIDYELYDRGNANMLLATTAQLTKTFALTELRVLNDMEDRRYSLPEACVGASLHNSRICAIAGTSMYITPVNQRRFTHYDVRLPGGGIITGYIGTTTSGRMIVTSGSGVYSVSIPN